MTAPKTWRWLPIALAWSASIALAQQPRRIDDAALKNAGKSGGEWLTYGLTQGETRYSPLDQINATNVKRLALAWSYDLGAGGGGQEATPLVWMGPSTESPTGA
jgi:glucose dehydrogenase